MPKTGRFTQPADVQPERGTLRIGSPAFDADVAEVQTWLSSFREDDPVTVTTPDGPRPGLVWSIPEGSGVNSPSLRVLMFPHQGADGETSQLGPQSLARGRFGVSFRD
jgi:hypothetical protein